MEIVNTQNYEKIYIDENKGFFLFSFQAKDINRIIPMHFHKEIEVLYCISGKMKIWVEGKIIILQPGQFFVINSLVPHSTQSYEQGEFVVFYFHSKLFLDQEARINVWEQKDKQDIYQQEIKLIQQIFASTQEEDPYIVFHQRSLLNEFIYILLKEFSTNEVLDQRTKNRNKKIKDIIHLMQENYASQLTLEELAHLSGYTATYLSRMIKESTGQTFSEYKKSLCLEHAINMIENTELTLEIIAQKSGFANEKSLRTAFKKAMLMTPREYIKKIKNDRNNIKKQLF